MSVHKVKSASIQSYKYTVKRGAAIREKQFQSGNKSAPLLALIINKHRGKAGELGLYGADMKAAIEKEWKRRTRAIGFLRAGFLPALAAFAKAIGKPVNAGTKKWLGRTKYIGRGVASKPGMNPTATFEHAAFGRNTSNPSVVGYVEKGLQDAIAQEVQRMKKHMEDKLQRDSDKHWKSFPR